MPQCSVKGCRNHSKNGRLEGIRFFCFPKDGEFIERWKLVCKQTVNIKTARICSVHFLPSNYKPKPDYLKNCDNYSPKHSRTLLDDAVPTECLQLESVLQEKEPKEHQDNIININDNIRFPSNETQKLKWVENMGRKNWIASKHSVLCSEHFSKECIDFRDKLARLRKGSIPTIFGSTENNSSLPIISESIQEVNNTLSLHSSILPQESHNAESPNPKPIFGMKIKSEILETDDSDSLEENQTCEIFNEPERIEEVLIKCEPIIDDEPTIDDEPRIDDEPVVDNVMWMKKEINEEFVINQDLNTFGNNIQETKGAINNDEREHSENANSEPAAIETKERPFTCDICQKAFTQLGHLKTHKLLHSDERPYTCGICQKAFYQKSDLKRHERIHSDQRPHACDTCDKKFIQLGHLKIHKRVHSDERPYICDICRKTFTQSGHLKTHKRLHSDDERPYTCDICQKAFYQKSDLKRHKGIHSDQRPHACDVCEKRFTQIGHLKSHRQIHSDERLSFACNVCQKKFDRKDTLIKHKRIHSSD